MYNLLSPLLCLFSINPQSTARKGTSTLTVLTKGRSIFLLFIFVMGIGFPNTYAQTSAPCTMSNSETKAIEQCILEAIANDNYDFVEVVFQQGLASINDYYDGKTFIGYAAIHDKPEMIRLLFSLGADMLQRSKEGFLPMDLAKQNQAYYAQAELIVLQA